MFVSLLPFPLILGSSFMSSYPTFACITFMFTHSRSLSILLCTVLPTWLPNRYLRFSGSGPLSLPLLLHPSIIAHLSSPFPFPFASVHGTSLFSKSLVATIACRYPTCHPLSFSPPVPIFWLLFTQKQAPRTLMHAYITTQTSPSDSESALPTLFIRRPNLHLSRITPHYLSTVLCILLNP